MNLWNCYAQGILKETRENTKSQERDTFKAIFTATKEFQISDRANNLDQLITSGLYNFNVGMNNSASGNGYGACLVFRGGDPNLDSAWWIIQIHLLQI